MPPLTLLNLREQLSEILRKTPEQLQPQGKRDFIQTISKDSITIKDPHVREADKLQQVYIFDIPLAESEEIWCVNLEANVNYVATGEKIRMVETALVVSHLDSIDVYLIELKTRVVGEQQGESDSKLSAIKRKFEDSISRMCVLLALRERHHPNFASLKIQFTGIVFYNDEHLTSLQDIAQNQRLTRLYEILKRGRGLDSMRSLTGEYKIPCIFFKNPQTQRPQSIEINFNALRKYERTSH